MLVARNWFTRDVAFFSLNTFAMNDAYNDGNDYGVSLSVCAWVCRRKRSAKLSITAFSCFDRCARIFNWLQFTFFFFYHRTSASSVLGINLTREIKWIQIALRSQSFCRFWISFSLLCAFWTLLHTAHNTRRNSSLERGTFCRHQSAHFRFWYFNRVSFSGVPTRASLFSQQFKEEKKNSGNIGKQAHSSWWCESQDANWLSKRKKCV